MAGDSSHLTKAQFWASLGLVSLAQNRNGLLPDAEARSTLIGVGPALPPPVLKGMETEKAALQQGPSQQPVRLHGFRLDTCGVWLCWCWSSVAGRRVPVQPYGKVSLSLVSMPGCCYRSIAQ